MSKVTTKDWVCPKCRNTGQYWNGEGWENCDNHDDVIAEFDDIIETEDESDTDDRGSDESQPFV